MAKVFLKNVPVLLLDEPTEGLGTNAKNDVLNALAVFSKDKTLIIVTHRERGLKQVLGTYKQGGYIHYLQIP